MAFTASPYDSYEILNRASDQMMREMDYRMRKQMKEMQYQMNYTYPVYQSPAQVAPTPKKDEKKEKLHRLIAHYYHARK